MGGPFRLRGPKNAVAYLVCVGSSNYILLRKKGTCKRLNCGVHECVTSLLTYLEINIHTCENMTI